MSFLFYCLGFALQRNPRGVMLHHIPVYSLMLYGILLQQS